MADQGLLTGRVRALRVSAALEHVPAAARVLDVGCGFAGLAGRFSAYVGCDRNPGILEENRTRFPGAAYVAWDAAGGAPPEDLVFAGPFDVVLMLALLEHLSSPAAALAGAAGLLAPGGRIVVTTPHPLGRLPLGIGARLGLLSTHAAEEHEVLLARGALEAAGAAAGLRLTSYRRFLFGLNQVAVFEGAP